MTRERMTTQIVCSYADDPGAVESGTPEQAGNAVFDLEVSEHRQVLLIRFRAEVVESDFEALDGLSKRLAGRQYDCIIDLSNVVGMGMPLDMATQFVAKRGDIPQAFAGRERIYVVPQHDLKLLTRLYASYQASRGWKQPLIVETLEEAFRRLDVGRDDFRPLA
jgi:hypothetical protein